MIKMKPDTSTLCRLAVVGTLMLAATVLVAGPANAQPPREDQPPGGRGGGEPGQQIRAQFRQMQMMQPSTIFVAGERVYIVRGNTLYQFDSKDLKLIKKVMLEEEPPPFTMPQGDRPAPPRDRPDNQTRPPAERDQKDR